MYNSKRGFGTGRGRGGYGQGRGGSHGGPKQKACFYFKEHGTCKFGSTCKFSHDLGSNGTRDRGSMLRDKRAEETLIEQEARASYGSWRSIIRRQPRATDLYGMQLLWDGALEILNGDDRDWKQTLPKDLDSDENFGRQHMLTLLRERVQASKHELFIQVSRSFLLVMTHTAIVDCLSVDTYVGTLYNFMSGVNGSRAIPFFQHLCETLVATRTDTSRLITVETIDVTLIALSNALFELLQREYRARFNEDLPSLINSLETAAQLITEDASKVTSDMILSRVEDLRTVVARANGLIAQDDDAAVDGTAKPIHRSAYERDAPIPGGRHDNDNTDITQIEIFPTRAEIMSEANEVLPTTDRDQPHHLASKIERHIDTHFRLFRHEIFGELKDSLGSLMQSVMNNPGQLTHLKPELGDIRSYAYPNSFVGFLGLNKRGELQVRMCFAQPKSIRQKSKADRRKWWEDSRRLEEGVLLSFIWVHDSNTQHLFFTVAEKSTDANNNYSLTSQENLAIITLKLTSHTQADIEALLSLSCQKLHGVLLEYPRVLPATFVPVLKNLQRMQRMSRLPFREWILPDRIDGPAGTELEIPPPLYARTASFSFPLTSILKPGSNSMSLHPATSGNNPFFLQNLEQNTELDRGQCVALIAALSREFAFIQGPPGTGKSFLGIKMMKVLLDVRKKAGLGPIVVVCYTNHALDQFLEHLIGTGIRKIIRVGGQSRSELLEEHNLRHIAKTEGKSKHEKWQAATAYKSLEDYEGKSKRILGRLHGMSKHVEWRNFDRHLEQRYPRIYNQFRQVDEDGFTIVGGPPFDNWATGKSIIRQHLGQPSPESSAVGSANFGEVFQKATIDVHSLSYSERRVLIERWTRELQEAATGEFFEHVKDAEKIQQSLTNVHEEVDRRVLQNADVIGLTTSGLAKHISTLQHVRAKVVICEEAGEVLEPHIISALLPTVEHFIQIGDHQQLRPSVNNFHDLSLESARGRLHQLDRSQFERLSVGEPGRPLMPVAQLGIQRRMRPEISNLIRETIYNNLIDHASTTQFPDVVGMRKNVSWLDHDNMEDSEQAEIHHTKSKSNTWEVEMVHALVRHMVRQGVYNSSEIAVLTPYTGQLQKLRTAMRSDFEIVLSERDQDALVKDGFGGNDSSDEQGHVEQNNMRKPLEKKKLSDLLRIATVDNFQGEEAKIIIISLVRANKDRKVGFLRTTNRINVLLSRAQHGMYLIGNTDTYSNVSMWQKVIDMLRAQDCIATSLDLCCPRHMNTPIQVKEPDDFAKFSPEGGCDKHCMDRLPDCGHQCQARCHSKAMHDVFKCEQPCQRRHQPCNHACQKQTCGEDCGKCMVTVNDVQLPCGHSKNSVPCHMTQHPATIHCNTVVDKIVPGCGHTVQVGCFRIVDESYKCPIPCGTTLKCGHICPGSCGHCKTKTDTGETLMQHKSCEKECGRRYGTCNHNCRKRCHDGSDCGLCTHSCEVSCKHSRCTLKCHEACAPCIEPCTWSCAHQGDCTMPCSAPCNRLPCNKRCTRPLPCGHQCPGLCGEDCLPEYCKECEMKLDEQADILLFLDYRDIDLDETPVVALACGHFFTAETLDGLVGLKDVYDIDPTTSDILGLREISSTMAPAIPKCPHCQCPIRQFVTQRYNRLINRAVIDEMSKRFIVTGQIELQNLQGRLTAMETDLEETRSAVVNTDFVLTLPGSRERAILEVTQRLKKRYKTSMQLHSAVVRLQRGAAERHQPAHKLHEAIVHATQRNAPLEDALAGLSLDNTSGERDHRITLGAKTMELKISCLTIEDQFHVLSSAKSLYGDSALTLTFPGGSPLKHVEPFLASCAAFITTCTEKTLPKLAVEASLYYARITHLYTTSSSTPRSTATTHHSTAQSLLLAASALCAQGFRDASTLLHAVTQAQKLLRREWYEEVTADEVAGIKAAMVSGAGGIATHSGHWYNCVNGHPFAIGECGMPMELARCPECGAEVGGRGHVAVRGVTRAEEMEG
ncbi:P-loop containing nucleoside triphosphate hydrolase protein [Polyplosphaeria fusca]|uniref:P-loop containing nucleoside triphosphate hydrolase protein n=1 Tax=Polyplosphaeria fusca TaxID=682080 RepID=A0A9P4QQZ4_9PLEO|nr:P-loop containing nucleoside triphosphate hydrolase protein [Polyplosphaeria fusca]